MASTDLVLKLIVGLLAAYVGPFDRLIGRLFSISLPDDPNGRQGTKLGVETAIDPRRLRLSCCPGEHVLPTPVVARILPST